MTTVDHEKKLSALIKRLRAAHGEPEFPLAPAIRPEGLGPIEYEFVYSFLLWESTAAKAAAAMTRLHAGIVDYNELRVCFPEELVGLLGERYPLAQERAMRLRACFNDLYRREHSVSLERLQGLPKRDARIYLDTLEGMVPFVASRSLLQLGAHAFPVDHRIATRLVAERALPPGTDPNESAGWLERHVRSGQIGGPGGAYSLVEAWIDALEREGSRTGARRRRPSEDPDAGPATARSKVKATEPAARPARRSRKGAR